MTQRRINELLSREGPRIRKRFIAVMSRVKDAYTAAKLEQALAEGRIAEVLDDVEAASGAFASRVQALQDLASHDTAEFLSANLDKLVSYDAGNPKAVAVIQQNRARLVGGITEQQRQAIVEVLSTGTAAGDNPRKQAVRIRDVIGLTPKQAAAVARYRAGLEAPTPLNPDEPPDPEAPASKPAPTRPQEQIDRMVERVANRMIKARAETIARTESLSAVHEGLAQAFGQAIDNGTVDADQIVQRWVIGGTNHRPWHESMHGQEQPWGTPFTSGKGNLLRWPGDVRAPPAERLNCQCAVARRIVRKPDIAPAEPVDVEKRSPMVICITGGPGTGKTTLGQAMAAELGLTLVSTDDFIGLGWSRASAYLAERLSDGTPRIVEGVAVPRALRKLLALRPGEKPCDRLIVLTTVHRAQTPEQAAMGKGIHTVLDEILPALIALGVEVDVRVESAAA